MSMYKYTKSTKLSLAIMTVGVLAASSGLAQDVSVDAEAMFADAFGTEAVGGQSPADRLFMDAFGAETAGTRYLGAQHTKYMFADAFGAAQAVSETERVAIRNTYLTDLNAPEWAYVEQAGLIPTGG